MAARPADPAPSAAPGPGLQAAATEEDSRKDPIFLVMFTGQIESAEASFMRYRCLYQILRAPSATSP